MATAPTLTRLLLRTKQAAAYLSMSEWKLRRLIQSAILTIVQDHEGGPFLLDVRDLDAYIEGNKHHAVDAIDWRPIPIAVSFAHPPIISTGSFTGPDVVRIRVSELAEGQ
jgi:excisionase family DNA binding protein